MLKGEEGNVKEEMLKSVFFCLFVFVKNSCFVICKFDEVAIF